MAENSQNREVAIQLSGVKKMYKLGQIGGGTLQADLQSWWARIRGKEDPNTRIGTDQRLVGKTFMALNGIDLTVYKGEALGIIGGNGAGKSTMLKLLSRVTAPTEGEIDIYGRITSMLEVGTGFNGEMTGRENVYLNGAILGMSKAEIDAKMEDIIEFSEVRDFIDTPVKRYSSGMFVKLAFSVAAHLDSEIMIMDEVLAVGDMAFQKKCLDKMRDAAKKEGRTVLYVSHNMGTIRRLCDRCIVLDKGKVIFNGDVEAAIACYLGEKQSISKYIDFQTIKREPWASVKDVEMLDFEICDRELPIYTVGEKILGRVHYLGKNELNNVFFRIVLKDEEGNPVMMAMSAEGIHVEPNSHGVFQFELDISRIAPGSYKMGFLLYESADYGTYKDLDGLSNVVRFEVQAKPGFNHNILWKKNLWGYIYSDNLVLEHNAK